MSKIRVLFLIAAATLAGALPGKSAEAQEWGGLGWGAGWPYNFQSGIYGRTNAYTLPYFTLHPPVYYSYVVPRPYGYSPFALPPGMEPAEMRVVPIAQEIENPHFQPKKPKDENGESAEAKKSPEKNIGKNTEKTTRLLRVIENPHYQAAPVRLAKAKE